MNWNNIPGWFDFQDIYSAQVSAAKDGAHFVEVGAWLGKSTVYMAKQIANFGRRIKFDAVDTWEGSDEEVHKKVIRRLDGEGKTLFDVFQHHLQACGVEHLVNPVVKRSVDAAKDYDDQSLDFVFIDAEHTFEAVCQDIDAWLPKIKPGGVLAGHDLPHPPVKKAVIHKLGEFGPQLKSYRPRSWVYEVWK